MLNKRLSPLEIAIHSKERSRRFYVEGIPLAAPTSVKEPQAETADTGNLRDAQPAIGDQVAGASPAGIDSEADRLLKHWLTGPEMYSIQSTILDSGGIHSGSKGSRLTRDLFTRDLIRVHKIQKGKGKLSVWEPTDKAFEVAAVGRLPWRTKGGGYLHSFCAYHIERWYRESGYSVQLECFLPANGKAVDLVCRSGEYTVFVEVAVSPPLEKEIDNIIKDFCGGLKPDQVVLAVTNARDRQKLSDLISRESQLDPYRNAIEVKLAGDFVNTRESA